MRSLYNVKISTLWFLEILQLSFAKSCKKSFNFHLLREQLNRHLIIENQVADVFGLISAYWMMSLQVTRWNQSHFQRCYEFDLQNHHEGARLCESLPGGWSLTPCSCPVSLSFIAMNRWPWPTWEWSALGIINIKPETVLRPTEVFNESMRMCRSFHRIVTAHNLCLFLSVTYMSNKHNISPWPIILVHTALF